jgi:uncharacterized protein DUF1918
MTTGKVGDEVIEESERVGHKGRTGEVLQVLGSGDGIHYRVRWEDGRETVFFPTMGSLEFVSPPAR